MSKEAFVLIIDVGKDMKEYVDNHNTRFDIMKQAVRSLIQQKLILTTGKKSSRFGCIFMNTSETENPLADENPGQYPHIKVAWDLLTPPKLEHLEMAENARVGKGQADPIDAILVALGMLRTSAKTKAWRRSIFLISDFSTPINDTEQFDLITEDLNAMNVQLSVIGIGFRGKEDEDSDDEEVKEEEEVEDKRSELQKKNEGIMKTFVDKVNKSYKGSATKAIKEINALRSRGVNQRSKKIMLEFTEEGGIPIQVWSRSKVAALPSLKKKSKLGEDSKKVKQDRSYRNKNGDVDTVYTKDDIISGFKYGHSVLPFDDQVMAVVKEKEPVSMKMIGFVSADEVPQHMFMGTSDVITAQDNDDHSQAGLSSLIHACHQQNMYGFVRFVKTTTSKPKLFVLIPRIKRSMECFIMNQIPFLEDVRHYSFASFKDTKKFNLPSEAQLAAAEKLIESLDLMTVPDEDGDEEESLKPTETFNPIINRVWENITRRALDPSSSIQPFSDRILSYFEPNKGLFEKNKDVIDAFTGHFQIVKNEKKKQGTKRKRAEELDELMDLLDGKEAKKSKPEEDGGDFDFEDLGLDEIGAETVTKIGTTHPIEDFEEMLKKRDRPDLFIDLLDEMWRVIDQLIVESTNGDRFSTALECIKHMRKQSVKEEEAKRFNSKFKEFKKKHLEKTVDMWAKVVDAKIILIHKDDFDPEAMVDLDVSKEEAEKFLESEISLQISLPVVAPPKDDDEDLFDDLM